MGRKPDLAKAYEAFCYAYHNMEKCFGVGHTIAAGLIFMMTEAFTCATTYEKAELLIAESLKLVRKKQCQKDL